MAELLLELLSEEIPARMQARAAADLERLVSEALRGAGLAFDQAQSYVTPRRLTLVVQGLPTQQPDVNEERKGPREGAPDQAIQGFLKANGLDSLDQAELRETKKGTFYFVVRQIAGQPTKAVLPDLLSQALRGLPWPKSMRWTQNGERWVRPLRAVLAVFDGAPLDGALSLGDGSGVPFTNRTVGHRFLAPQAFAVDDFADYRTKLEGAKVLLDAAERRDIIAREAKSLAEARQLTLRDDPALLDEVAGLVEWPVVLMGEIDETFMDLPEEVLITSMRAHQKYFALLDASGRLANRFVLVTNTETQDQGAAIVAGNERVLRARLADARFFWDQDRKEPLAERVPQLDVIVFHAKLGSLAEKVTRIQTLAVDIAQHVKGADRDRVRSAARLAKADLVTGMVGEFPELQGTMGRYYALADGEHSEVAEAIAEHYAPLGPSDPCPTAPVSVAVALADKIDTLVGFFAIGETPTGSKDPFALRRAALGVIRLIVENNLRLPLSEIFKIAGRGYHDLDQTFETQPLLDFIAERMKVALKGDGVRHDLISAVFALGGEDDLVRLLERVRALQSFLGSDDGANLLVAYRRAANIVRIESKKDGKAYAGEATSERFQQDEEQTLQEALQGSAGEAAHALDKEDFTGAMSAMAKLRRPVDAFFDHVTVNAEDPTLRENRLRLLSAIGSTLNRVADFDRIEG